MATSRGASVWTSPVDPTRWEALTPVGFSKIYPQDTNPHPVNSINEGDIWLDSSPWQRFIAFPNSGGGNMSGAFYWAEFAKASSGVVATPGGILTPGPGDIGTALVVDPAQSLQWGADKSSVSEFVLQPIAFSSEDEHV